jgi:predicted Zn-dependent protease
MRLKSARIIGAFAALVTVSGEAVAQRNATESWDPSAREFGRPLEAPNVPAETRNTTLEALNKILSSPKLSAFDRSIYLSIRAYQLSKVGREADSQKDIAEMGKVLPSAWPLVLSGTVPELAGGGDRAAALRTLDSALQQKPGDSWLVIAQAQVYMQIGDFPRALGLLDGHRPAQCALLSRPRQLQPRPVRPGGRRFRCLAGRPDGEIPPEPALVALCRPSPLPA